LMLAANPRLAPSTLDSILFKSAVDRGTPGYDIYFGWGRVNAAGAVALATTTVAADTTSPTASITTPSASSKVSGLVPVDVSASDNVGVTRVDLWINGSRYATDTTSPYAFSWDTTKFADGSNTVQATAYDAAGNQGNSSKITVTVGNNTASTTITAWVEDAVPVGAALASSGGDAWSWVSSNPAPYSGTLAHQSAVASGVHQHYFWNATATLSVGVGDTLFAYVYLDPANPPSEVMLQWYDGSWEHRAYWGANLIGWGTNGSASRRYMGVLPPVGQWVRLEVPASQVGLEGRTLSGMAYALYNGRATWDRAGRATK
jgi:hypothetical protein